MNDVAITGKNNLSRNFDMMNPWGFNSIIEAPQGVRQAIFARSGFTAVEIRTTEPVCRQFPRATSPVPSACCRLESRHREAYDFDFPASISKSLSTRSHWS
jgi:hypothetical protein